MEFLNSHPFFFALAIFLARICDVSLGTVRTIIVFRGYRLLAAIIGFLEVTIWIMAAGQVLKNFDVSKWYLVVGYAAGYATGNIVGIWLESKLAIGNTIVRVFSRNLESPIIATLLPEQDFFVTEVVGQSADEKPLRIVFVVSKRKDLPRLLKLIKTSDPDAFYTIEDIRSLHEGIYPKKNHAHSFWWTIVSKRH